MKIYTKTGDSGETGLVDGSRLPKHDPRVCALGALDEANAAIGLAALVCSSEREVHDLLLETQSWLFSCGSRIAEPAEVSVLGIKLPDAAVVGRYETSIDTLTADLAPLKQFILPGGSEAAARLHVARSSVRHAEREIGALRATDAFVPTAISVYINRLSDWLFTAARYMNYRQNVADVVWRPQQEK